MSSVVVCHACDLVHRRAAVLPNARVRCVRCRAELYRTLSASVDVPIALASSALVLLLLSNVYPLVALQVNGSRRDTTLVGAALALYGQGYASIAALVLLTTELIPLFQIVSLLYVLWPLRSQRQASGKQRHVSGKRHAPVPRAPVRNELIRALTLLRPWGMPEVFMLGALVALVKISATAQVIPGIALFSYGALMLMLSALTSTTPTEQLWRWIERTRR